VSEDELRRRQSQWEAPPLKATRGILAKYIRCVQPASLGCVTDE
jgi:dihydroxy-acid dehydratase